MKRRGSTPADAALLGVGACFLLPLLWLVLASLDTRAGHETRLPEQPGLANFAAVMTPELVLQPLWNSVVLSAGTGAVTLGAAVLAAYPALRNQGCSEGLKPPASSRLLAV
ncbi:hypothetical protein ACIQCN_03015 [Pseudarthrobacter sp. NPDC092424]|uniref:hypothetical protein n=1 Tax=Pseudarthrobacter sp. NPDC092424 TaxID=3364415 RepID=UPI00381EC961